MAIADWIANVEAIQQSNRCELWLWESNQPRNGFVSSKTKLFTKAHLFHQFHKDFLSPPKKLHFAPINLLTDLSWLAPTLMVKNKVFGLSAVQQHRVLQGDFA